VSWYQKGKTNLDFTEARDSVWQRLQLGHMQVCTSLQIDIHTSTPPLSFLQAGCPFCCPTNSVKALKAIDKHTHTHTHTGLTALFSGTTRVSRHQKGKTNLDFTEARDSEWQWHKLGHMQVCISLQTMPVPHHSFFTGRMLFLPPNQQRQSTEGNRHIVSIRDR